MSFKEMLEEDLAVFFDAEALAEKIIINSKEIICFLTNDKFLKNNNEFGAFVESKLLTIKTSDYLLIGKQKVNDELRINGKNYRIKGIDDSLGTVKIRLEGNKS